MIFSDGSSGACEMQCCEQVHEVGLEAGLGVKFCKRFKGIVGNAWFVCTEAVELVWDRCDLEFKPRRSTVMNRLNAFGLVFGLVALFLSGCCTTECVRSKYCRMRQELNPCSDACPTAISGSAVLAPPVVHVPD
jgi:hypothetical protein